MIPCDIGVIGLAVMGQNLVLNIERHGAHVAVFNRTAEKTRAFIDARARGKKIHPTFDLGGFVGSLSSPRKILLMVKAGAPTDALLAQLWDLVDPGDLVMDGGNAHPSDTDRRILEAEKRGIRYLGVGVSGGESGALYGPAIMAGGSAEGYASVRSILEAVAADGPQGPCCAYFGPRSAGHYVKMVHNGIEYAIMQALAETYDLMKRGLGLDALAMAECFGTWNRGDLESYLVEITEKVLRVPDEDNTPLVERILDAASQKGTGKWSSQSALDVGSPSSTIAAAVFARIVSSLKPERLSARTRLCGPDTRIGAPAGAVVDDLHDALLLTVLTAYAQGLRQLQDASADFEYALDLAEVARVWMDGCIVRSSWLGPIRTALLRTPAPRLLFLVEPFVDLWRDHHAGFRRTVARAAQAGIPAPCMSSALAFLDAYRTGRLPANLLQAQRDFFGAHTYERTDRAGTFHTKWERS